MDKNVFLTAKAAVTALCAAFSAAFGWLGWLVVAWVACMALDWLTGSGAACARGEWCSATARAGIWHKCGMIAAVIVAALADAVLHVMLQHLPGMALAAPALVTPVVLVWYIFTELGSVAENAIEMGANVPEPLVRLLKAGRDAANNAMPKDKK